MREEIGAAATQPSRRRLIAVILGLRRWGRAFGDTTQARAVPLDGSLLTMAQDPPQNRRCRRFCAGRPLSSDTTAPPSRRIAACLAPGRGAAWQVPSTSPDAPALACSHAANVRTMDGFFVETPDRRQAPDPIAASRQSCGANHRQRYGANHRQRKAPTAAAARIAVHTSGCRK